MQDIEAASAYGLTDAKVQGGVPSGVGIVLMG